MIKKIILLILLSFLTYSFIHQYWKKDNFFLIHDAVIYYDYLPAFFIHEDLSLRFLDFADEKTIHQIWIRQDENNNRFFKMTYGVSLMQAPFIFIAHQIDKFKRPKVDGFSSTYRLFILIAALFYLTYSLIYLSKFLRHYFDPQSITISIIILCLGTNLLQMTVHEPGMSHVYTFSLISFLIYNTHKWYEKKRLKNLFYASFLLGLIGIIRPINLIFICFFLLYQCTDLSNIKHRVKYYLINWKFSLKAILFFFIPIFPQLLFWKLNTGSWLHFSYQDESFFFNDPKIIEGLFGFRKGWLIYTPIMIFSIIGLFLKHKMNAKNKWLILSILIVGLYVTFSWWCWWYGGSFGARTMVDFYPLLAIPLCIFIVYLLQWKRIVKNFTFGIFILLIGLNLFQTYQYQRLIIHWDSMTYKAYKATFLELERPENFEELIEAPNYEAAKYEGLR